MVTFTEQQIEGFTREEKEMLYNLAQRHLVEIPKELEDFKKQAEEEQNLVRKRLAEKFAKEKDNENYAEWMESQLDTNRPTTQFF